MNHGTVVQPVQPAVAVKAESIRNHEHHRKVQTKLAIPNGKPSMMTASKTPMSTPSSRAFVATIPSKFPENASCSMRRRSCRCFRITSRRGYNTDLLRITYICNVISSRPTRRSNVKLTSSVRHDLRKNIQASFSAKILT